MDIVQFLSIGIVGVIASLIIMAIKNKFGTTSFASKLITVGVAIIVGFGYHLADHYNALPSILSVLTVSSTIYAFFIKE